MMRADFIEKFEKLYDRVNFLENDFEFVNKDNDYSKSSIHHK